MPHLLRTRATLLTMSAALGILGALAVSTPVTAAPVAPPVTPRVMGGVGAGGDPRVVALGLSNGSVWSKCSAAMWKPRILLTAAHCTTLLGSGNQVVDLKAFAPGVSALTYSNTGPQGASGVPVIGIYRPAGYVHADNSVQPNDISVIVLGADLAPGAFTRLATRAEMASWAASKAPITHVGYGLTGPAQDTTTPNTVTLPLVYFDQFGRGTEFGTAQSGTQGICPGDSGSPAYFHSATGDLLLGDIAGGNSACIVPLSTSNFSNIGVAAIGYLDMVNAALTQAGYPTIPSAPAATVARYVSGMVHVGWTAPKISPESVIGYEVIDETGAIACTTAALQCQIANGVPGNHTYVVRSSNAQGEGDAVTAVSVSIPAAGVAGMYEASDKGEPWVAGSPTTVIDSCWQLASDKPQLQIKRGAKWLTIASSTMSRDPSVCPGKKNPFIANFTFTLKAEDLGAGEGDSRRVSFRTKSGRYGDPPFRKTVFMSMDALLAYLLNGGT